MHYEITDQSTGTTATATGRDAVADILHGWFTEAPDPVKADIDASIERIRLGLGGQAYTGDDEAYLNIVILPVGAPS